MGQNRQKKEQATDNHGGMKIEIISLGDKTDKRKSKLQIIMVGWRLRSSLLGTKQAKERASYR